MRKIMVLLFAVCALAACGSTGGSTTPDAPKAHVSSDGQWVADGFEAVIANNSIVINIVNGDTSGLYWKGTFPGDRDTSTVTSVADRAALDASLLGSSDSTKVFIMHETPQIDFQMTALGTTRTVHLKKA